MTKKHFEAIAAIILDERPATLWGMTDDYSDGNRDGIKTIAERLADYFATENPQFNRARFLAACGVEVQP